MDISNWSFYHKINLSNMKRETTQMVYEPRVSVDKKTFCMNFNISSDYQKKQTKLYPELYTEEFIDRMFNREIKYLEMCSSFYWVPEILDIDTKKRQIFFKWYGNTCNDLFFQYNVKGEILEICLKQFEEIVEDQIKNGIYKITLYPHCHYLDNNKRLRTFDFYACCTDKEKLIPFDDMKPLLGDSLYKFTECVEKENINLKLLYENSIKNYSLWPKEITEKLYEKFFRKY